MLLSLLEPALNSGALTTVNLEPIYVGTDDRQIEGHKAVVVGMDTAAVVSDKYKLLDNREMLEHVSNGIELSGLDTGGMTSEVSFDGRRTLADINFPAHSINVNGGETNFRIVARNSYTGEWVFGLYAGGFRIACLNGMLVGNYVKAYTTKHMPSLSMDHVAERIVALEKLFVSESARWGGFSKTGIDRTIAIDEIRKHLGITAKLEDIPSKSAYHKLLDLWNEYSDEMGENYWALYNVFTHFSTHGVKESNVVSIPLRVKREHRTAAVSASWEIAA